MNAVRPPAEAEFDLVLIDGDNLLHRVRGMRDEAGLRWLLPRLRAWRAATARVLVMLDGHPDPGDSVRRRVSTGVEFHHSLGRSGDDALLEILSARPYADRGRTLLVTDDRALTERARHAGGITRRLEWFVGELARSAGEPARGGQTAGIRPVGIGRGRVVRPPAGPGSERGGDATDADRPAWHPGRGATRKRGNPKRGHP